MSLIFFYRAHPFPFAPLFLPKKKKNSQSTYLNQVDRDTVRHHQRRQVADVRARRQKLERVPNAHVLLHLVLATLFGVGAALGRGGLDARHDLAVEPPKDARDHDTEPDDQRHHAAKRHAPAVDARREAGPDLREVLDGAPREDQRDVGAEAEEGVEGLGLVDGGDLVGEAPEEHRDDDRAPELWRVRRRTRREKREKKGGGRKKGEGKKREGEGKQGGIFFSTGEKKKPRKENVKNKNKRTHRP